jgi:HD-GYP domain-containing protein (c-di-GMP phosphodiesterase class II)
MLADQTAVALRSILEHEAKEENFLGILQALTHAIDAKSRWTAGHSARVAETAARLGLKLQMSESELRSLRIAAILHDAGKLGVREAVLDKPGRLEPEEYEEIKRHPSKGGEILSGIRSFTEVVPAVVHHHERWDGGGYPDGLVGEAIPLASRIITVADVWDAITDDRPYRAGFPRDEALRFMEEHAGKIFDPRLVRLFLE